MNCYQKFCARISPRDWLLLSQSLDGSDWTLGVWGPEGCYEHKSLGIMSETDANAEALRTVDQYLASRDTLPNDIWLSAVSWRVVVSTYAHEEGTYTAPDAAMVNSPAQTIRHVL